VPVEAVAGDVVEARRSAGKYPPPRTKDCFEPNSFTLPESWTFVKKRSTFVRPEIPCTPRCAGRLAGLVFAKNANGFTSTGGT